jgi:hypothetical protein
MPSFEKEEMAAHRAKFVELAKQHNVVLSTKAINVLYTEWMHSPEALIEESVLSILDYANAGPVITREIVALKEALSK